MKNKKLIFLMIIFMVLISFNSYASYFDDTDWVDYYYNKQGEPDYADGDLEDKLGDSGYYYDLFPEERDGEIDDYVSGNSSGGSLKNYEMNADFINNMRNLDTRVYKFEFPDGTTGSGTRTDYERIMREKYTPGPIKIGNKIYYRNSNGIFKTGWHKENDKWYYFDLLTGVLVLHELREIGGVVYYFKPNGQMAHDETVNIEGVLVRANTDGSCFIVGMQ